MMQKRRSLLGLLFHLAGVLLMLPFAISYFAGWIPPTKSLPVALCGMFYPYLLVVNFCFLLYWILHRNRMWIPSLVLLLAGLPLVGRYYQYAGVDDDGEPHAMMLKTMTYNVQLCGAYRDNRSDVQALYRDSIFRVIREAAPDLLCMQEFYQGNASSHHNTALLDSLLPSYYCYPDIRRRSSHYIGNLIYCRFPVVGAGCVGNSYDLDNHSAIYADVLVGQDTFRIYNLHLKSVQFQQQDYDFAQQLTDANWVRTEPLTKGSKRILKKLKVAYATRTQQVDSIVRHIDQSPYPLIVCGDFNDTPWSYTYRQFKKRLSDSFVQSGIGRGNSFDINRVLRFRIDYVFCDKRLKGLHHTVLRHSGASDHYAVMAGIVEIQ